MNPPYWQHGKNQEHSGNETDGADGNQQEVFHLLTLHQPQDMTTVHPNMKIIASMLIVLLSASFLIAADPPAPKPAVQKNYLEGISLAPVGAYRQAEFDGGPSEWGAGVDVGLPVNKFVSIHVRNLAFESEGDETRCEEKDTWRGSAIDETTVYGNADFVKFYEERLKLSGQGGITRNWSHDDWGFGIGLAAQYNFTKNVSLKAGREIRAWFNDHRDWLTTASLGWTF